MHEPTRHYFHQSSCCNRAIDGFKLRVTHFSPQDLAALAKTIRKAGHSVTISQIGNTALHETGSAAQPDFLQGFYYGEPQNKPTDEPLNPPKPRTTNSRT